MTRSNAKAHWTITLIGLELLAIGALAAGASTDVAAGCALFFPVLWLAGWASPRLLQRTFATVRVVNRIMLRILHLYLAAVLQAALTAAPMTRVPQSRSEASMSAQWHARRDRSVQLIELAHVTSYASVATSATQVDRVLGVIVTIFVGIFRIVPFDPEPSGRITHGNYTLY